MIGMPERPSRISYRGGVDIKAVLGNLSYSYGNAVSIHCEERHWVTLWEPLRQAPRVSDEDVRMCWRGADSPPRSAWV